MGHFKQKEIDAVNKLVGHVHNIKCLIKEAKDLLEDAMKLTDPDFHRDYLEFHERPEDLYTPEEWRRINKLRIPDSVEENDRGWIEDGIMAEDD